LGARLIRAEAADRVVTILRQGQPPDGRAALRALDDGDRIAFKTGTSYGFRDAVAVGVGSGYAVAVWTGRPDGGSRPGLTGRAAALPVLFDVFDRLTDGDGERLGDNPVGGAAPSALSQVREASGEAPQVLFPSDGVTLHLDPIEPREGFILSGEGQSLRWYIDGAAIPADPATRQTAWRPRGPGFYRIEAVDADGRRAVARVQVLN
jgi:penicillin-binding protein 1C